MNMRQNIAQAAGMGIAGLATMLFAHFVEHLFIDPSAAEPLQILLYGFAGGLVFAGLLVGNQP